MSLMSNYSLHILTQTSDIFSSFFVIFFLVDIFQTGRHGCNGVMDACTKKDSSYCQFCAKITEKLGFNLLINLSPTNAELLVEAIATH